MDDGRRDIHNSAVPALCRSCEARHRGICGALTAGELAAFARQTHKTRRQAGAMLAAQGDKAGTLANLMRGVVALTRTLPDGRRQVVALQFAPDVVGRLHPGESTIGAEAATDVELCSVPRPVLERMAAENPALGQRLMQQALRELDDARGWMLTLGRKTAAEKVASVLWLVAAHGDPALGPRDGMRFELPLSRADIADFLGLTVETVSRELTRLRRRGVISTGGQRAVVVHRVEDLRAAAG